MKNVGRSVWTINEAELRNKAFVFSRYLLFIHKNTNLLIFLSKIWESFLYKRMRFYFKSSRNQQMILLSDVLSIYNEWMKSISYHYRCEVPQFHQQIAKASSILFYSKSIPMCRCDWFTTTVGGYFAEDLQASLWNYPPSSAVLQTGISYSFHRVGNITLRTMKLAILFRKVSIWCKTNSWGQLNRECCYF